MANPFQVSYVVCLLRALWAQCLGLLSFVSPRCNRPEPSPPASRANRDLESQASEGSWQAEKAQFMRSPSLLRSGPPTANDLRKKGRRAAKACAVRFQSTSNPQVGVLDWKSLDYKISVPPLPDSAACPSFHRPFPPKSAPPLSLSSAPPPPAILLPSPDSPPPPASLPEIATVAPLGDHTTRALATPRRTNVADCTRISDQHALSALLRHSVFAPTSYASSPRSAVTGPLSDAPPSRVLRAIPLPQNCEPPRHPADPLAQAHCGAVPYPDLFDFAMYAKRASMRSDAPTCVPAPARAFAFGVASIALADVGAPALGLATPPLRIVKRAPDDALCHSQPAPASAADCIHTSVD